VAGGGAVMGVGMQRCAVVGCAGLGILRYVGGRASWVVVRSSLRDGFLGFGVVCLEVGGAAPG
jgi:hypothetical protein